MAHRGTKPRNNVVKLASGARDARPTGAQPAPKRRLRPPVKLEGRPAELWRTIIAKAWYLTPLDAPKAWLWCELQAEAEAGVAAMIAARLGQLRGLGSELGLDPSSRTRFPPEPAHDSQSEYFS